MENVSKLPVNYFKWVKGLSKSNEDFIKIMMKIVGYILEVDGEYAKNLFNLHKHHPFLPETKETKKFNKFICNTQNKEIYVAYI